MSTTIVSALQDYQTRTTSTGLHREIASSVNEPSLDEPAEGKPISHHQLIDLIECLDESHHDLMTSASRNKPYTLESLLRGTRVYASPVKPRAEAKPEYTALMTRLRREEEARSYQRMLHPSADPTTAAHRLASSPHSHLSSPVRTDTYQDDDDFTYAEVNKQMAVIANVLVSIVACSAAIWLVAWNFSTPQRLGLSMGGGAIVGTAEVVIYSGYLRRVREAGSRAKKLPETKEIIRTWVIDSSRKSILATDCASEKPKI
ncbi:MAG: hypothetical protein M1825_004846 [Sarcosagium campestre]|nr:MAG: hypothetical protein M1825_004846 [Sarcosagium campestre]